MPISILIISQLKKSVVLNYIGLTLDETLSCPNYINDQINKTLKGVGPLPKLSTLLPRQSLLTIYRSFKRSHLDYGDVIYDQLFMNVFPAEEILSNIRLH